MYTLSGEYYTKADLVAERERETAEREAEIAEAVRDSDIAKVRHITEAIRSIKDSRFSPAVAAHLCAVLSNRIAVSNFSRTAEGENAIEYLDDAFSILEGGAE